MAKALTHRLCTILLVIIAALGTCAAIVFASGQAAVVITHGISMNPVYYEGDLVVVARAPTYQVGDIAAYDFPDKDEVALHRIIDGDSSAFVLQGDNNESVDPIQPSGEEIVGRAVLHIPQGGVWLRTLTSPPVLGVLAFGLITAGGAATTRKQRKRRKAAMAEHSSSSSAVHQYLGFLPAPLKAPAALGAGSAVVGVLLGALAWSGPLQVPSTALVEAGTRMDFSYTADVGESPAYDDTTATSPEPIFRTRADTVDVEYSYRGDPGTVTVNAELSMQGGWTSTVSLTDAETFTGSEYTGTVQLDLAALEARAEAAAAATGLPMGPVTIALVPEVTTGSGAQFRPALDLNLAPVALTLPGGAESLSVTDTAAAQQTALVPRTVGVNGVGISAASARVLSAVLLAAAVITGAIIMVLARRITPEDEAAAIRRRYAALLVRVHPMPAPQGRPVIDVTTFPTLAKLAERYGLLVLHWSRSGMETFVVQDENVTYRYRPESVAQAEDADEAEPDLLDSPVGTDRR
jgi:signal peptidase I